MLHEAMVKLENSFLSTTLELEQKVKEKLEDISSTTFPQIGLVFDSKLLE
jgi:hypothetical protein